MAENRMINTRFWHDSFVREKLNPLDRYLFLYFLTNDKTNISGIYELPMSMISNETGLEKEMLVKMFKRLKGKIEYVDGWVAVKNFIKYQNLKSPQVLRGVEREIDKIPPKIIVEIGYRYGMDMSQYDIDRVGLTKLNLTKPNLTKLKKDMVSEAVKFQSLQEKELTGEQLARYSQGGKI